MTLNIWFGYGGSRGLVRINGRLSWLTQDILPLNLVRFDDLDDLVLVERYMTLLVYFLSPVLIFVWRFFECCRLVIFWQFRSVSVKIDNSEFDIAQLATGIVTVLDVGVLDVERVRLAVMFLLLPILEQLLAQALLLFLFNQLLALINLNSLILVIRVLFRLE